MWWLPAGRTLLLFPPGRLLLPGGVLRGVCGVELAADGRHVAATHPDAHGRPCKVRGAVCWRAG